MKPTLFIGSSEESLDVAYAVQENLEQDAEVTVWSQGIFELSKYSLESLDEVLGKTDFGVFVFSPDDISRIRDIEFQTVRDNVIFELGMFIGRLGRQRSFLIMPRGVSDFHLPTDLLGITSAGYDPGRQDSRLEAALGPACHRIRRAIVSAAKQTVEQLEEPSEPQPPIVPEKTPELISTTQLSKIHDCKTGEMFTRLQDLGLIVREDEAWQLTDLGKAKGGVVKQHSRFGDYIAWPADIETSPSQ